MVVFPLDRGMPPVCIRPRPLAVNTALRLADRSLPMADRSLTPRAGPAADYSRERRSSLIDRRPPDGLQREPLLALRRVSQLGGTRKALKCGSRDT